MFLYRHYSFDLWLTLIRSNPLFKQERVAYFHAHFNRKNKSIAEVTAIFRQVDLMCNAINERTGKNIDAEEMYLMVICQLNDNDIDLCDIDTGSMHQHMEELLFAYMPQVYCNNTHEVLATLKNRPETSISILSNTGFIKGMTLRKILKQLELSDYFDFQLYSDEEGLSKPSSAFFDCLKNEVFTRRQLLADDILHIGDNPNADIKGAAQAGIASMLVNSNNVSTIKLITNVTANILPA